MTRLESFAHTFRLCGAFSLVLHPAGLLQKQPYGRNERVTLQYSFIYKTRSHIPTQLNLQNQEQSLASTSDSWAPNNLRQVRLKVEGRAGTDGVHLIFGGQED